MKRIVGFRGLVILFCTWPLLAVFSQDPVQQKSKLEELSETVHTRYQEQFKRAQAYAQQHNIPMSYRDVQGNLVLLVGVADDGTPMYETTDNAGAAITTGVDKLRTGGGLGLNLQGEGMEVGIWDGGIVEAHIEFDDRILLREGSTEDSHATHVTGTILASGINAQAKGMAPKVKASVYDFSNDTPEMLALAKPDQSGIILSNHSYGLITGWRFNGGWQWNGNAAISNLEDWRFGFYSSAAQQWDQLALNAPYYLIVKSAGNDRTDTGNGSFPPDCNGGSGYDCISDKSVAKNILTVGAVNKVTSYTEPASVVMSSFSSWGPTDDGRIKPDLVAAGVNIFSTLASETLDNAYGSQSGTSMSAPNATGSLLLLQELYKGLHSGNYMRAPTLKALAIHSAKEAGPAPGPDYMFGWGLLDVEAGAKVILNKDDQNVYMIEETLQNGQTFELTLNPKVNTKITATLVWNDPAGTPVATALDPTDLMLVNDLDMRISDNASNEFFPWILNPGDLSAPATRGDNVRDNVEKIEFNDPEPREYKLTVRHKGNLQGGQQVFSLIVQYTSVNDPRTAYYWIGRNGNWNNSSNWSLTSGGPSAGVVPGINDRVIVDENSFNASGQAITLTANASCHSITWLAKTPSGLSLNNRTLTVAGGFTVSSSGFSVTSSGIIRFTGENEPYSTLNLAAGDFTLAELQFDGAGAEWQVVSSSKVGTINLIKGTATLNDQHFTVARLLSTGTEDRVLQLNNSILSGIEHIQLNPTGLSLASDGAYLRNSTSAFSDLNWSSVPFNGILELSGTGKLNSTGSINAVKFSGQQLIEGSATIQNVDVVVGSRIEFSSGSLTSFGQNTTINSSTSNRTTLTASGSEPALLQFDGHYKLCFDNLNITRVNLAGSAVINSGLGSVLVESENWIQENCDDVLFPDFEIRYACVNGYTEFIDKSSGTVTSWQWNFGEPSSSGNTSTLQNAYHSYASTGNFTVTLEIGNGNDTRSYSQEIEIIENTLMTNSVILSGNNLFSQRSAPEYEWFFENVALPNSNTRTFNYNGEFGSYFVVTKDGTCSRASTPFVITAVEEPVVSDRQVAVYPNPATSDLTIEVPNAMTGAQVEVITTHGVARHTTVLSEPVLHLDVRSWPSGLYFVQISKESIRLIKKVIIR
jgi:hypothetical protein